MKLASTGSFAPHWMGMALTVPNWNLVTRKDGLRLTWLSHLDAQDREHPRVQMGIPIMPLGIGMGMPRGIDGYIWVSMGMLSFLRLIAASNTAIGSVADSGFAQIQNARPLEIPTES